MNDVNRPLSELLSLIVDRPEEVADFYQSVWRDRDADHLEHYYAIRTGFNRTGDPGSSSICWQDASRARFATMAGDTSIRVRTNAVWERARRGCG